MMLDIDRNRIDLWCVYLDEIQEEVDLLARYRDVIDQKEREIERSFYFIKDQRRYLVTRALVRIVLSQYAPIKPEEWIFESNAYGCPQIANKNKTAKKICFNISHTQELIVLGISGCRSLGVDVENKNGDVNKIDLELAKHFLSENELRALYELPEKARLTRCIQYWTLKEAYVKARSMGLSIPLDQFSFHMDKKRVALSIAPQLNDSPEHWHFRQIQLQEQYLVSICAHHAMYRTQHLVVKKTIPLHSESDLSYIVLLHSD